MSDLISRQAAMDAFLADLTKREEKNLLHTWSTVEVEYFIADILEQLPTIDPVKHGHWIYDKYNKHTPKCSVCGNFLDMRGVNVGRGDANYCPNCGARMDEEVKNG